MAKIDAADADLTGERRANLLLDQTRIDLANGGYSLVALGTALLQELAGLGSCWGKLLRSRKLNAGESGSGLSSLSVRAFRAVEKLNQQRACTHLRACTEVDPRYASRDLGRQRHFAYSRERAHRVERRGYIASGHDGRRDRHGLLLPALALAVPERAPEEEAAK